MKKYALAIILVATLKCSFAQITKSEMKSGKHFVSSMKESDYRIGTATHVMMLLKFR